jgi:hypothetical protein
MSGRVLDLYKELTRRQNYRPVFEVLRRKVREAPRRLQSNPVNKSFNLEWILQSEEKITTFLIRHIRQRRYFPETGRMNEVLLDKKRRLYALSWPDRIVEAALARLLSLAVEPCLSPKVFSYRSGFSNHTALRDFAEYARSYAANTVPLYIIKRDITKYAETVDVSILTKQLEHILGKQDVYAWTLLRSFLQPDYYDSSLGRYAGLAFGLPVGFSATVVGLNLYLHELDEYLGGIAGGFYSRYSDDILFAHPDIKVTRQASDKMIEIVTKLRLKIKEDKLKNIILCKDWNPAAEPTEGFTRLESFDYLGFNIDETGGIFLSQNKLNSLKSEFRRTAKCAFLANLKYRYAKSEMIDAIINSLNICLKKRFHQPFLTMLFTSVTNEEKLRKLDRWIAKLSLRYIYGTGHDRVFRYESLKSIRQRGLLSLVHMRRLEIRGQ